MSQSVGKICLKLFTGWKGSGSDISSFKGEDYFEVLKLLGFVL